MAAFEFDGNLQTFLNEPRVDNAPRRVWRDWAIVAAALIGVTLEAIFRNDLTWPVVSLVVVAAISVLVLWRRTHPLLTYMLAFGAVLVLDLARLVANHGPSNIYSAVFVLLFMYSIFRWGSGRDTAIATVMAIVVAIVVNSMEFTGWGDVIGGFIVLAFPGALGLAVRYRGTSRAQALEQAKIQERETLARELHDTVAHHVSAIAIQAQAGRFLAKSNSLEGAADALATIEEEASRTLTEMRSIVGVLRSADSTEPMAPQHSLDDIDALAASSALDSLDVVVSRTGDLATVGPTVGAAAYRLAQESITNAVRHARSASVVNVHLHGSPTAVDITINNDGDIAAAAGATSGFGLIGMAERATLLGGTLEAGPQPHGGWSVRASLPRESTS